MGFFQKMEDLLIELKKKCWKEKSGKWKIWGKFMPEEKKIGGKACPIEFFFFFFDKAIMILILIIIIKLK